MLALVILLVGALLAIGLWSWLASHAGRHGSGGSSGATIRHRRDRGGPSGLRSARAIAEDREALEAEDLAQMLELHNAWRRRRGQPERTVEEVEMLVAREARRGREEALEEQELEQLLAATNARRRARGLPERDRDEVRRQGVSGEPG